MKFRYIFLLLFTLSFTFISSQSDSIHLFYDIGVYKLNKSNYTTINNYLINLDSITNYNVSIISSADYLGSEKSNYKLAQNRADQIKKFIQLKSGKKIQSFNIINNGEINNSNSKPDKKGKAIHRKTSVIFQTAKSVKSISKIDVVNSDTIVKKKYTSEYDNIKLGEKVILKNLIFQTGTAKLKNKSYATLLQLAKFLKENPTIEIEIGGHVCCNAEYRDPNATNIKKLKGSTLSTKRARFVYKYLYFKGIKKDRMAYYGYGFQLPIFYPEKSKKEMNANKRVEIKITKM